MRGVNKVIIVGNLGADPEHKTFANGGAVTNIVVATSEQWNDKQTGEKKETTEWHRISLYDRGNYRLAEIASKYLRKGSQVYIEGSLHTRKWQDQNGQDRYTTEIRAESMQMLGSAGGGQGGSGHQQNNAPAQVTNNDHGTYGSQDVYGGASHQGNPNNAMSNQNSFAQNSGNSNPNNPANMGGSAPAQNANTFNNQTSNATEPMKDTPRDDDIPF